MMWGFFEASAQVNCVKFNDTIGCAPFTVNIEYCGPIKADGGRFPIFYNYEPGNDVVLETFTYQNPGIYDLRQVIAINEGDNPGIFDSTFKNAFRVVSNPEVQFELTPCHNRSLNVAIDSSSYDFYRITNNLNSNSDTLREFGNKTLDFSGFSEIEVEITIIGLYDNAPCSSTTVANSPLIENMLPETISALTEYEIPEITFISSGPFNYRMSLFSGVVEQSFKLWNNNIVSSSLPANLPTYEDIEFSVSDACGTNLEIFKTPSFRSETSFENNRNIVSETSPVFSPTSVTYLKDSTNGFVTLPSNEDINIICNDTNCYYLRTNRVLNGYDFTHFSTGECGRSFSNDIPLHPATYNLNNTIEDSLLVSVPPTKKVKKIEINDLEYDVTESGVLSVPFNEQCINLRFLNTCDIWSNDTIICPLILTQDNTGELTWNSTTSENYSLLWKNELTTDTLFLEVSPGLPFSTADFPAQEFCIFLVSSSSNSLSNELCYESETFLFIPDIASSGTELNLKNRFLSSYSLNLFDLNGNIILTLNENNKLLSGLEPATYFYILQGESESGEELEKKGTLIIK